MRMSLTRDLSKGMQMKIVMLDVDWLAPCKSLHAINTTARVVQWSPVPGLGQRGDSNEILIPGGRGA